MALTCLKNINELITMDIPNHQGVLLPSQIKDIVTLKDAFVLIEEGNIHSYGLMKDLTIEAEEEIDATGQTVIPGFVDPHTHLVFAGSREYELEQKILQQRQPTKNARMSGGINDSVRFTRAASKELLLKDSLNRLKRMQSFGTTTAEAKSGYGLDLNSELKSLEVIQEVNQHQAIDLVPTFLGAHAIPKGVNRSDYVNDVLEMLPIVAEKQLAEFCDVFCEQGFFTPDDTRQILLRAHELGFALKVHADELTDTGGAIIAGELKATSADHLQFASDAGLKAMKTGGTIAVLLPGTAFYLDLPYCRVDKMRDIDLPIALSTDLNPGGCYCESMQFMITLACTKMKMLPLEALAAATLNAAYAINRGHTVGSITPGKQADLLVLDAPNHQYIPYHFGVNLVEKVMKKGRII